MSTPPPPICNLASLSLFIVMVTVSNYDIFIVINFCSVFFCNTLQQAYMYRLFQCLIQCISACKLTSRCSKPHSTCLEGGGAVAEKSAFAGS